MKCIASTKRNASGKAIQKPLASISSSRVFVWMQYSRDSAGCIDRGCASQSCIDDAQQWIPDTSTSPTKLKKEQGQYNRETGDWVVVVVAPSRHARTENNKKHSHYHLRSSGSEVVVSIAEIHVDV